MKSGMIETSAVSGQTIMSLHPASGLSLIGLFAIVLLTRLPFLVNGYGDDPDAWRLMETARLLATEGVYQPSRFPGYPLPEFTYAALYRLGITAPVFWNGLTAVLSGAAASFFYLIYSRSPGRPMPAVAALAMSLVPVLYIQSTTSMDYIWALCFILGSTWYILEGRILAAGVLLGLAIACRLTSGAFLLPAILLIGLRTTKVHDIMRYGVAAGLIAGLFYLPAVVRFGSGFLTFSDSYPGLAVVVARATVRTFGPIGSVAVAAALMLAAVAFLRNPRKLMETLGRSRTAPAAAVYCALVTALYLRLPHEAAYLIPLVPFGLLLLADLLSPRAMVALFAALIGSSFVGNLDSGGRLGAEGMLLQDVSDRHARICIAGKGAAYAASLPPGEYLVAAHYQPYLQAQLIDNPAARDRVVYGVVGRSDEGFEIFASATRAGRNARFHILEPAEPAVAALGFYRDTSFKTVEIDGCDP